MATNKPRFSITVSDEIYEAINTYQHEHRLATQTKAISALIEMGIHSLDVQVPTVPLSSSGLSEEDWQLVRAYHAADPKSRALVDLALAEYKNPALPIESAG